MNAFRVVVIDKHLFDLGYKGDIYSWSNRHIDFSFIKERLDRAFANSLWKS